MEHPILNRIRRESFTPLGWFAPTDMGETRFVILIGNVGPDMFRRFARAGGGRAVSSETAYMDEWTRAVVEPLVADLDAKAVFPFDVPHQPFLSWARRGGAGHVSPLGLNIHRAYGLWHAYRAALLFPVEFDLPRVSAGPHPCETCLLKPCLSACPVSAFDGKSYDVEACGVHVNAGDNACMDGGCLARLACPIGVQYQYAKPQAQFHMKAFANARMK
jgi:ferredoxin-like protein FixX